MSYLLRDDPQRSKRSARTEQARKAEDHERRDQELESACEDWNLSHFPNDIHVLPSAWTRTVGNVVYENAHDASGHFAAYEQPDATVGDLRSMFGKGGGAEGVVKVS
ncbi:hypothetical protein MMC08_000109 [Hypocenomyce scalaris]|nr:hypothetical protein [Hypocenomyce scalaris]